MGQGNIAKTIFSVTAITVLSRLMSLLSVQLYLSWYGANDPWLNIYDYALKAPNIIFTCIGTLLTTIVVPTYSAMLAKADNGRGEKFLNDVISISSLLILCLIGFGFILAPAFFKLSAFGESPEKLAYAVFSLRVLLPVMFFYGLNFIFQGILQSHGHFKLPAAVTIPSSLITIGYVLLLGNRFGVTGLLFATLIGLSLQALFLLPAVIKTGYRFHLSFDWKDEALVSCAKQSAPILIAVSAYQMNTLFNLTMALRLGQNAILSYVQNIILVSILAFVYAITAVYYPKLSVLWAQEDREGYKQTLSQVLQVVTVFLIPATVGFILIRYSLFELIARWGKVTAEDVGIAGNIMALYALGILPLGFKEILDRAFYAQKNTRVSALFGFIIMAVNIALSLLLIDKLGIYALPLSYSISSSVGVLGLWLIMGKKIGGFNKGLLVIIRNGLLSSLVMGCAILLVNRFLLNGLGDGLVERAVKLFVPVALGGVCYLAFFQFLYKEENLWQLCKKSQGRQ